MSIAKRASSKKEMNEVFGASSKQSDADSTTHRPRLTSLGGWISAKQLTILRRRMSAVVGASMRPSADVDVVWPAIER
jgi:hypothetical protein